MVTLRDVVLIKVRSMGPCSFRSVLLDAREQMGEFYDDYQVAGVLTQLIKDGYITLYDDGTSFYPTDKGQKEDEAETKAKIQAANKKLAEIIFGSDADKR